MQAHHFYIHLQEPQFSNDLNHLNQFLTQNAFIDRTFKFVATDQPYWSVLFLSKPRKKKAEDEETELPDIEELNRISQIGLNPDPGTLTSDDMHLYDQLKEWRTAQASIQKLPPFMICTNQCMSNIVKMKPNSLENLLKVPGWGTAKNEKYGNEILAHIASFKHNFND